jgi:hypothetical protein
MGFGNSRRGIVNLSGRGMLVVSVARQLGSGNFFDRLLCCPAEAERGRKRRSEPAKLTMPIAVFRIEPATGKLEFSTLINTPTPVDVEFGPPA